MLINIYKVCVDQKMSVQDIWACSGQLQTAFSVQRCRESSSCSPLVSDNFVAEDLPLFC